MTLNRATSAPFPQMTEAGPRVDLEADNSVQTLRPEQATIRTRLIDPIHSSCEWDRLVALHGDAQLFHTSAWARVLAKTYGHKPFYTVVSRGQETIALIPLMEVRSRITGARGVSLPFSDFCGPLVFRRQGFMPALEAVHALGRERGWNYLEFRGGAEELPAQNYSPAWLTHHLDLRLPASELFGRCASGVRRAVRKAEKCGLTAEVSSGRGAIKEFYQLHCQTRRRHNIPPQPWRFFEQIQKEVLTPGGGYVLSVRRQSKPVASAVFFRHGKNAIYKFGASDFAFQEFRGNNLVIWEAIKFLSRSGVEFLHLGRTDIGHESLRRYKLSWGTVEKELQYLRFDFRSQNWVAPRHRGLASRIPLFRYTPLLLNRFTGMLIYPHLD
jgi:CelD/BcsL family acetyltransferase involved in cellulose biosynthesis